jgi:hypothetical protein
MEARTKSRKDYIFLRKGDELAQSLMDRVTEFQEYIVRTNILAQWRKNQRFYENNFFGTAKSADILDAGAVGELKATSFNHFRNVIRHMLNQLTASTPSFDVSAANTDVSSRRAADIGKEIINYYFKVKRVARYTKRSAEFALVLGDGYPICEWNPSIGRKIGEKDNGRVVREGDFDFSCASPYDVFFDYLQASKLDHQWVIFRRKRNKYDLAKIFPKQADRLIGLSPFYEDDVYELRLPRSEKEEIEIEEGLIESFIDNPRF